MKNNKRSNTRVDLKVPGMIQNSIGDNIDCQIIDLSIRGVLIKSDIQVSDINEESTNIIIPIDENYKIVLNCSLVRREGMYYAFNIQELSVKDLYIIQNVVAQLCGDMERFAKEMLINI